MITVNESSGSIRIRSTYVHPLTSVVRNCTRGSPVGTLRAGSPRAGLVVGETPERQGSRTLTGTGLSVVEPFPSWPDVLAPQH